MNIDMTEVPAAELQALCAELCPQINWLEPHEDDATLHLLATTPEGRALLTFLRHDELGAATETDYQLVAITGASAAQETALSALETHFGSRFQTQHLWTTLDTPVTERHWYRDTTGRRHRWFEPQPTEPDSGYSIKVLRGMEGVRARPGMYIGDVVRKGYTRVVAEVLANSVDEFLAGHATEVEMRHLEGGMFLRDDGRGIPLTDDRTVSWFTTLHHGATRDGHRPHIHLTSGLGLSVVSALSAVLEVTSHRDDGMWRRRFSRGRAIGGLERLGDATRRGTDVWWVPDPTIFRARSTAEDLRNLATRTCRLFPPLRIFGDWGDVTEPEGVEAFLTAKGLSPTTVRRTIDAYDVHVSWADGEHDPHIYVNGLEVRGDAWEGVKDGFRRRRALASTAVALHVQTSRTYGSPYREMNDPDMRRAIAQVIRDGLRP